MTKITGQEPISGFFETYYNNKSALSNTTQTYNDIDGSPYLNSEFKEGLMYIKDKKVIEVTNAFLYL